MIFIACLNLISRSRELFPCGFLRQSLKDTLSSAAVRLFSHFKSKLCLRHHRLAVSRRQAWQSRYKTLPYSSTRLPHFAYASFAMTRKKEPTPLYFRFHCTVCNIPVDNTFFSSFPACKASSTKSVKKLFASEILSQNK